MLRDLRVDVAVREQDVRPAVVVEVEEVDAEAEVLPVHAEAGAQARLLEGAAVVAVERRHLLGEVRPDDVQPAVAVVVADADAHARERGAFCVEGAAGGNPDLAEGPVLVVAVEQARRGVAGHVDVGPAVVVEVRRLPRPCRRSPWAASCCRRRPWRTARADGRSPTPPRRRRTCRRPCCDRARSCRRRIPAVRRAPGCRCRGSRRPGPASARPGGSKFR